MDRTVCARSHGRRRAQGTGLAEQARELGVDVGRLYWWRKRLAAAIGHFVELVFAKPPAESPRLPAAAQPFAIQTPSGRRVEIGPSFDDASELERLLEVLEEQE